MRVIGLGVLIAVAVGCGGQAAPPPTTAYSEAAYADALIMWTQQVFGGDDVAICAGFNDPDGPDVLAGVLDDAVTEGLSPEVAAAYTDVVTESCAG